MPSHVQVSSWYGMVPTTVTHSLCAWELPSHVGFSCGLPGLFVALRHFRRKRRKNKYTLQKQRNEKLNKASFANSVTVALKDQEENGCDEPENGRALLVEGPQRVPSLSSTPKPAIFRQKYMRLPSESVWS